MGMIIMRMRRGRGGLFMSLEAALTQTSLTLAQAAHRGGRHSITKHPSHLPFIQLLLLKSHTNVQNVIISVCRSDLLPFNPPNIWRARSPTSIEKIGANEFSLFYKYMHLCNVLTIQSAYVIQPLYGYIYSYGLLEVCLHHLTLVCVCLALISSRSLSAG